MDLYSKVKKIVAEELGVSEEQVVPEAKFIEDLGADSLDTAQMLMKFEEEFDISIPEEDAGKLVTVGDAVKFLESKQG